MHSENWDDLRFILAVVEAGTVSGAARALGVNHATVLRRIAAFEARHGLSLFDKTAQGYRVPDDRLQTIAALREAGAAMQAAEAVLAGDRGQRVSAMRVTSTDTLCTMILPDILARVQVVVPGLQLNLLSSNEHLDLARMQAEIAIRPTTDLPGELVGDHAASLRFAVFARVNGPKSWIALSGRTGRSAIRDWLEARAQADGVSAAADSFLSAAALAAAGFGRAVLPYYVGNETPGLQQLDIDIPVDPVPIWVATHRDLAGVPRIRDLQGRLVAELRQESPRLMGGA